MSVQQSASGRARDGGGRRDGATGVALLPSFLLGVGLGGFVDGILLHQILQWHHMLTGTESHPSSTVAGLETNTLADGFFHVATWVITVVGMQLAMRAWADGRLTPPWRVHVGMLLVGWGTFNLVEGVVDHHVLGLHHVRDDVADHTPWDLGFLLLGALLVVGGWFLQRSARPGPAEPSPRRR